MKTHFLIYLIVFAALSSCRSLISDVDGPKVDPKLVIFGVISPDMDTIEVRVSKSVPLDTPRPAVYSMFQPVENALVKIKNGQQEAVLSYNFRKLAYLIAASQMPVVPGQTYRLEVSAPGAGDVWAECTVPASLPNALEVTRVDSYTSTDQWSLPGRALSLRLADLPGTGHYYYVDVARRFRTNNPWGGPSGYDMIGFESGEQYMTDANKDGAYFLFRTFRFDFWGPRDTLVLYSALTDVHFFRYHQSVRFFSGDNPFGEPTPVYTNVVNGLGVFAACRERKVEYLLE
ncbi:MAG: DUF4249 domain-containing protein [Bacteroidetes bacterium]|nr:DUF4249 domain-containing protein [Bacteroidota bacterium]